jgi:hypothetical protein
MYVLEGTLKVDGEWEVESVKKNVVKVLFSKFSHRYVH